MANVALLAASAAVLIMAVMVNAKTREYLYELDNLLQYWRASWGESGCEDGSRCSREGTE